eukprot:TRINITY_DN6671_c0_g1_i1.p1 TRINITY_DN6671_c0_g1~~TRINITY_DN6671_c0_g1_i1.p1  ORF type:complete len:482 (-),score=91.65 TRINITY_DN6671_c0_g1_i1:99-1544(-)
MGKGREIWSWLFLTLLLLCTVGRAHSQDSTSFTVPNNDFGEPQCVPRVQLSSSSPLVEKLIELKQVILARLLPTQFEHHFAFSLPQLKNDPFLVVIVRPFADYGHDQVYNAIINNWFVEKSGGVLEIDCSGLDYYNVSGSGLTRLEEEIKRNITGQLSRCPESIILFRHVELLLGQVSDSIIDFLHDVSTMKVSMNGVDVIGYKAIYLLEVVIGNSNQLSPETNTGKLLFGEVMQQFMRGNSDDPNDLEWDLLGIIKHQQTLLRTEALQKIFRKWIATQNRLRLFWITDLSFEQRLDYYQKRMRPTLKALSREQSAGGYFEDRVDITFTEPQERDHCSFLSPDWIKQRVDGQSEEKERHVRLGLSAIDRATTRAKLEATLEGCKKLFSLGVRQFQLVVEGKELRCERLRLEGWDRWDYLSTGPAGNKNWATPVNTATVVPAINQNTPNAETNNIVPESGVTELNDKTDIESNENRNIEDSL